MKLLLLICAVLASGYVAFFAYSAERRGRTRAAEPDGSVKMEFRFDPPLTIPPHATALVSMVRPGLLRVVVKDTAEKVLADGFFASDADRNLYRLSSGSACTGNGKIIHAAESQ